MIARIAEIEASVSKLESIIKSLAKDREEAWAEIERLKRQLDEQELELLQTDEELQKVTKERDSVILDKEETQRRLEDVAARIMELMPLLPDSEVSFEESSSGFETNETC